MKFAKVMFLQVSVCPHWGGACVVAPGGGWLLLGHHAWLLPGGMHGCSGGAWLFWGCMVALGGGGMCGCSGRSCLVAPRGMHGCSGGACMVAPRGACVVAPGGHAWDTTRYGDTINERALRILLECILVRVLWLKPIYFKYMKHISTHESTYSAIHKGKGHSCSTASTA